jgi:hypothetical protein
MQYENHQVPTPLPLICDGVAITFDAPKAMHEHIIRNVQDLERTARRGRYRYAGVVALNNQYLPRWADRTGQSDLLVQCEPIDPTYRFLRCEFNPAKINIREIAECVNLWQPANLYARMMTEGIVTRFDIALDVVNTSLDDLVPYPSGFRLTELKCLSGRTLYAGTREGWCIYDKKRQIIERNARKSPALHDPVPEGPVARFEYRLKPKRVLKDVGVGINNPFAHLTVVSIQNLTQLEDSDLWHVFSALARTSSVNHALAQIADESTKKRYRRLLRENAVGWWKPDIFWGQLGDVVDGLIDPFGKTEMLSN